MKSLASFLFGILTILITVPLFVILLFNAIGLLFGFEDRSEICSHYQTHSRTNGEYYLLPITPYACKKDGGLLLPGIRAIIDWGNKKHEESGQ